MSNEFIKHEHLEKLSDLRLIDDIFMRKVFENNPPATELLLRIIMEDDKIKVIKAQSQYAVTNLYGHSVQLDVLAQDGCGRYFNVEVHSESSDASPQRARYYVGIIDTAHFPKRTDYRSMFDTYVIFITQNDVLGEGRPIYHIDRTINESGKPFNDGSHIIYVNGACRYDETALSKLMHDFFCTNASDMHYPQLQKRVKYFKETEEGAQIMSKITEELKREGFMEGMKQGIYAVATNMKKSGKYSDIAISAATNLTLEEIKSIPAQ